MEEKFYITTPIYYTNAAPTIGSAYTTIAADVLARWNKLLGKKVFFLTGTDEHGKKIQESAEKEGKKPKEFVDEIVEKFKLAWKKLNINYDNFLRTTNKEHEKEVKKILQELYDKKFIYKGYYESYYCVGCEQYKTKSDLIDDKCPLHPNRKIEIRREEAYLFKLSKFQDKLLKLIKNGKYGILPEKKRAEIIYFIKQGLQDISISRKKSEVYWGIELPFDKEHTCFVWVDAFWNYITGLQAKNKFKEFWPPDVQLMANDIFRVHATIWPALLLALGYELPKTLFIHGYFTFNGQKISKSLGVPLDPIYYIEKYGTDSLRYFLIRNISFGEDGDFSEQVLKEKINGELVGNLGNLVSRVLTLAEKTFKQEVSGKIDKKFESYCLHHALEIQKHTEKLQIHKAVEDILNLAKGGNKYIDNKEAWKLNGKKLKNVLCNLLNLLKVISILSWPFIPETAEKIASQIDIDLKKASLKDVKFGSWKGKVKKKSILFARVK